nr:methyl-accepting chemotaxis protein [uncultured Vibrio sp.]
MLAPLITYQSNLLALHAAIEVTRAEQQGQGFLIVADELKKLTGMVNCSAENIEEEIVIIMVT